MDDLVYVNTPMSSDLKKKLDQLTRSDGIDNRAAFIRFLIIREWNNRFPDQPAIPNPQDN